MCGHKKRGTITGTSTLLSEEILQFGAQSLWHYTFGVTIVENNDTNISEEQYLEALWRHLVQSWGSSRHSNWGSSIMVLFIEQ